MSWTDNKIGEGPHGCMWLIIHGLDCEASISQNTASYCVTDAYLGIGLTIMKDTPEAETLRLLISDNDGPSIDLYLTDLVLSTVSRNTITRAVEDKLAEAYADGARDKARSIRDALGYA